MSPANPLRLILVSPLPPPVGGIATWTRVLMEELGHRSDVAVRHLDTAVRWRAVTHISPLARLSGGPMQAIRDYGRLKRMLRDGPADVVHICTSAGLALAKDVLMLRAVARHGAASVIHFRMGRIPALARTGGTEWRRLKACAEAASVALTLDARSASSLAENCPGADVRTMPNMVDIRAVDAALGGMRRGSTSAGCGDDAGPGRSDRGRVLGDDVGFRVAYVGHLLPAKGVTDLVQAAVASQREVDMELVGPVAEDYRRTLDALAGGASERVRLYYRGTLSHDDAIRAIAGASAFALPSHTEGFPNVVAEAMACGRPVLATDVGAIPEMLEPRGAAPCGICVAAGDQAGMAAGLRALCDDPEWRRAMGRNGRARAELEYSAPVVTRRLADLWRSVAP